MTKTAPGLNRPFAADDFPWIGEASWDDARDEAFDRIVDTGFQSFASDIDPNAVAIAQETVRRAGVSKYVKVFEQDALTVATEGRRGTVVCNPPYGERLMTPAEAEALYRDMGRAFANLSPWQIYIITSHPQFERFYGMRADKIRKLYNGMIPCNLYQYFKPKNK